MFMYQKGTTKRDEKNQRDRRGRRGTVEVQLARAAALDVGLEFDVEEDIALIAYKERVGGRLRADCDRVTELRRN
jgi:hypothetical protein